MFERLRAQFNFSGMVRINAFVTLLLGIAMLAMNLSTSLNIPAWLFFSVSLLLFILSFTPCLKWYYNRFTLRGSPVGREKSVGFTEVRSITVLPREITIYSNRYPEPLYIKLSTFRQAERLQVRALFLELDKLVREKRLGSNIPVLEPLGTEDLATTTEE